jgi:integrase
LSCHNLRVAAATRLSENLFDGAAQTAGTDALLTWQPRKAAAQSCINEHDRVLVPTTDAGPADKLNRATAAYLTRFTGSSREHARSDLRCLLAWCADRNLHPHAARRPHLQLYIRWMQEIRHFKPSTVSRRFSVVAGFYQTTVIDGALDHSPAEHVRRPAVPPESPTLGFTHLQFEAMLTASRESANPSDFALVAMLAPLGLRIFEATSANIADLGGGTLPPRPASLRQRHQSGSHPAAARRRPGHRPR